MNYWRMANARIAKPSARLTPEEDAERFVLAWERRMIRNWRAWRRPNPNGTTYAGSRVFTWLALPYWTAHYARNDPAYGEPVRVPQSKLVLRPAGCECPSGEFARGRHDTSCPIHNAQILARANVRVENGGVA